MKITREEYESLLRKHPHLSPTPISSNCNSHSELRPTKQKRTKRKSLDCSLQGKDSRSTRFEICFTIYAHLPLDWDNYWIKCLQDCIIQAGFLYDDKWNVLQGRVVSKKAYSKEEEKTVVTIREIGEAYAPNSPKISEASRPSTS